MDNITRDFVWTGTSGLLLVGLLMLSGCGGPPVPPGGKPGGMPMPGGGPPKFAKPPLGRTVSAGPVVKSSSAVNANAKPAGNGSVPGKPSEGQATDGQGAVNPMAPVSKIERAGNTVQLASEVLFARTNPFLDRLPRSAVAIGSESDGQQAALPLPADPFESVNLLGIAYSSQTPMALVSIAGGENQSQMVRVGDILMLDGGQIKVRNIGHDSIEMERMGVGNEKRTLNLPSIVGYNPSSSSSTDGAAAASAGAGSSVAPAEGQSKFSNLGKLSEGSTTKAKTPDVVLTEL